MLTGGISLRLAGQCRIARTEQSAVPSTVGIPTWCVPCPRSRYTDALTSMPAASEAAVVFCDLSAQAAKQGATILVKLLSAAGTGYFYVKKKNPRNFTQKLAFVKYDPRVRRHVLFTETKLK